MMPILCLSLVLNPLFQEISSMKSKIMIVLFGLWLVILSKPLSAETDLTELVKVVQPAVGTVVAYDVDHNVANIGTGFFINGKGHLITNYHVLVGKFGAEIKTADGSTYPIKSIIAENQATDLIKVLVDIPPGNLAMYYPEANALITGDLDPDSKTPSFKRVAARLERI